MKQVIQSYKTGLVTLRDLPVPQCSNKSILVQNFHSLLSVGTERSVINLGKKSLLNKARARPDLVKRAVDKAKKEGFKKTFQEAMGRLDIPTALGYSSSGIVVEIGEGVQEFCVGDKVACVGQNYASHAEFVTVPINLACKVPDNVDSESAAFGMLGTIAMHGIRCADLTFGSSVVVIGLGLLGLLAVQILKAYGCQVFALDLVEEKVKLAKMLGAEYASTDSEMLMEKLNYFTNGYGTDAAIVATATDSEKPVNLAIDITRMRGKIVIVGTATINPNRNELWHKEIEIVVSKASGPGSLDAADKKEGADFPISYIRWTEKRNLEEFIRLLALGLINVKPLITHRFSIDQANHAYDMLNKGSEKMIGVLFEYPKEKASPESLRIMGTSTPLKEPNHTSLPHLAVMGAGTFGRAIILPLLAKRKDIKLHTLVTTSGATAEHNAKKFGFLNCSTDAESLFKNKEISAIVALTPHNTHYRLICAAIENQKSLFIEKPLCIHQSELDHLIELINSIEELPLIIVGHNRRFSPHTEQIKKWLEHRTSPIVFNMRINAGYVPSDHWVHTDVQGRSRIVGEMSHFVDLMQYLIGSNPVSVFAKRIKSNSRIIVSSDNLIVSLNFGDGSIGNLTYTALGYKGYSRELFEIFFDNKTVYSEDFKRSILYSASNENKKKFISREKEMGYTEEFNCFLSNLQNNRTNELLVETIIGMQTIFAIEKSLQTEKLIAIT